MKVLVSIVLPDDDYNQNHGKHDGANNDDEVQYFSLKSGHAGFRLIGHLSNATEDSFITSAHDNSNPTARDTVCTLHTNTVCLEVVGICVVNRAAKWKRFTYIRISIYTEDHKTN
jgi:hypothetical protein